MENTSIENSYKDFNNSLLTGDVGRVLANLRDFMYDFCALFNYYLQSSDDIYQVDSKEIASIKTHLLRFNKGIFEMMVFEDGEVHTDDTTKVANIFRAKWSQSHWSTEMIFEGLVNSLQRSVVILQGLLELLLKYDATHESLQHQKIYAVSRTFVQVYHQANDYLGNLPPRQWDESSEL